MINKIIWLIETILLFLFSYVIPKDKDLILFWSMRWNYIGWNPKIYYLHVKNKFWDKKNILFFDGKNTNKNANIKTYWFWLKKYWLILRANILIIDACSFDLWIKWVITWNFNLVQMWHWEPVKKIWFLSELYISRRSKIVLFFEKLEYKTYKLIPSNPWTVDIIKWCFLNENVKWIWVPRNDLLLHNNILNLVKNEIVEKKISDFKEKYKKIILLAPTFRETDNSDYFSKDEAQKLNATLKEQNYLLLIKTHPNETRKFLHEKYSNLINITKTLTFDATDFLPFIDCVMTDYSSIYIDFLLTWKDIIFYQKDLDDYINKERWLLYEPEEVVIKKTVAYNFDELINILLNIDKITKEQNYKTWYNKLYELFFKWLNRERSTCEELDKLLIK